MNAPTIFVLAIVTMVFAGVTARMLGKKRRGQGGCSCGCSDCAMKDVCHTNKEHSA